MTYFVYFSLYFLANRPILAVILCDVLSKGYFITIYWKFAAAETAE